MGLDLDYIDGQTPFTEEEKDGLLIPTISTRGELDEFEQQNILKHIKKPLFVPYLYLKTKVPIFYKGSYILYREVACWLLANFLTYTVIIRCR